jgi:UDP-3-O-[3-hydroxymyristoyl] N-acetylglucosamine deacetylase
MTLDAQETLARPVRVEGTGLHGGGPCAVILRPAPPDSGRTFVVDGVRVPARVDRVVDTRLATTLGAEGVTVTLVEHLCAALHARGVDNVDIEVTGGEVPVLDGSARAWLLCLEEAGSCAQDAPRRALRVDAPVRVGDSESWAELRPTADPGLWLDVSVAFPHPRIGAQRWTGPLAAFASELSWARTFGFLRDAERLRAAGLARGASLDNTVVFDERGVVNEEGLRAPDEVVRHKALDAIGDLALAGRPVHGLLVACRAGHAVHRALLQALLGS